MCEKCLSAPGFSIFSRLGDDSVIQAGRSIERLDRRVFEKVRPEDPLSFSGVRVDGLWVRRGRRLLLATAAAASMAGLIVGGDVSPAQAQTNSPGFGGFDSESDPEPEPEPEAEPEPSDFSGGYTAPATISEISSNQNGRPAEPEPESEPSGFGGGQDDTTTASLSPKSVGDTETVVPDDLDLDASPGIDFVSAYRNGGPTRPADEVTGDQDFGRSDGFDIDKSTSGGFSDRFGNVFDSQDGADESNQRAKDEAAGARSAELARQEALDQTTQSTPSSANEADNDDLSAFGGMGDTVAGALRVGSGDAEVDRRAQEFAAGQDEKFAEFLDSLPDGLLDDEYDTHVDEYVAVEDLDREAFDQTNQGLAQAFDALAETGELSGDPIADLEKLHKDERYDLAAEAINDDLAGDVLNDRWTELKARQEAESKLVATAPRDLLGNRYHSVDQAEAATQAAIDNQVAQIAADRAAVEAEGRFVDLNGVVHDSKQAADSADEAVATAQGFATAVEARAAVDEEWARVALVDPPLQNSDTVLANTPGIDTGVGVMQAGLGVVTGDLPLVVGGLGAAVPGPNVAKYMPLDKLFKPTVGNVKAPNVAANDETLDAASSGIANTNNIVRTAVVGVGIATLTGDTVQSQDPDPDSDPAPEAVSDTVPEVGDPIQDDQTPDRADDPASHPKPIVTPGVDDDPAAPIPLTTNPNDDQSPNPDSVPDITNSGDDDLESDKDDDDKTTDNEDADDRSIDRSGSPELDTDELWRHFTDFAEGRRTEQPSAPDESPQPVVSDSVSSGSDALSGSDPTADELDAKEYRDYLRRKGEPVPGDEEVNEESVAERRLSDARDRLDNGIGSRGDYDEAQREYEQAKQRRVDGEQEDAEKWRDLNDSYVEPEGDAPEWEGPEVEGGAEPSAMADPPKGQDDDEEVIPPFVPRSQRGLIDDPLPEGLVGGEIIPAERDQLDLFRGTGSEKTTDVGTDTDLAPELGPGSLPNPDPDLYMTETQRKYAQDAERYRDYQRSQGQTPGGEEDNLRAQETMREVKEAEEAWNDNPNDPQARGDYLDAWYRKEEARVKKNSQEAEDAKKWQELSGGDEALKAENQSTPNQPVAMTAPDDDDEVPQPFQPGRRPWIDPEPEPLPRGLVGGEIIPAERESIDVFRHTGSVSGEPSSPDRDPANPDAASRDFAGEIEQIQQRQRDIADDIFGPMQPDGTRNKPDPDSSPSSDPQSGPTSGSTTTEQQAEQWRRDQIKNGKVPHGLGEQERERDAEREFDNAREELRQNPDDDDLQDEYHRTKDKYEDARIKRIQGEYDDAKKWRQKNGTEDVNSQILGLSSDNDDDSENDSSYSDLPLPTSNSVEIAGIPDERNRVYEFDRHQAEMKQDFRRSLLTVSTLNSRDALREYGRLQQLDRAAFIEATAGLTSAFDALASSRDLTGDETADLNYVHGQQWQDLASSSLRNDEFEQARLALEHQQQIESQALAVAIAEDDERPSLIEQLHPNVNEFVQILRNHSTVTELGLPNIWPQNERVSSPGN